VLSFIIFVCFAASTAAAFVTAPFIEFLAALFLLFAYSTKFNERFKGFHWPLMVSLLTYKMTVLDQIIQPKFLLSKSLCLLFHQGLSALCQCLHYLFHHLYNVCVQISGWSLKGCWGKLTSIQSNCLYRHHQWPHCLSTVYSCYMWLSCVMFRLVSCVFLFHFLGLWLCCHNNLRPGLLFHL